MNSHEDHFYTKLNCGVVDLGDLRCLWENWSEKSRLEAIKSIIYLSGNAHIFREKVIKMLESDGFLETID